MDSRDKGGMLQSVAGVSLRSGAFILGCRPNRPHYTLWLKALWGSPTLS